jgi:hypothetical protein
MGPARSGRPDDRAALREPMSPFGSEADIAPTPMTQSSGKGRYVTFFRDTAVKLLSSGSLLGRPTARTNVAAH